MAMRTLRSPIKEPAREPFPFCLERVTEKFPTHKEFATGASPTGIVAADFTGDGNSDLGVTDQTDNNLDILVGIGDGTFHCSGLHTHR